MYRGHPIRIFLVVQMIMALHTPASAVTCQFNRNVLKEISPKNVLQLPFKCSNQEDPTIRKSFDPITSTLTIEISSRLPATSNKVIKNLQIIDAPSRYFQAEPSTAVPPLDGFFHSNHVDALVWKFKELRPGETKTMSVNLTPTACSEIDRFPVPVDAENEIESVFTYTMPDGQVKRKAIPNIHTDQAVVDECAGRPDLHLNPAYSLAEYQSLPDINYREVTQHQESPSIWLDSAENGFWDSRTMTDIPIRNASCGSTAASIVVKGQGDAWTSDHDLRLFFELTNNGDVQPVAHHTATLNILNQDINRWEPVASITIPEVGNSQTLYFDIPQGILRPEHVKKYKLRFRDILRIIRSINYSLARSIEIFVRADPSLAEQYFTPTEFANELPSALRAETNRFIRHHPSLAWGKPSVRIQVVVSPSPLEKHTNNNRAEETVIITQ